MKRVIALLMAVGISATAFGQGELVFGHWGSGGGAITDAGGTPLEGTGFSGQLYAGPVGGALAAVPNSVYQFYGPARAGFLNTSFVTVTIPGVQPGSPADTQLRAWDNAGGSLTDWDAASAGGANAGISSVVASAPLGGPDPAGGPAIPAPNLPAIPGFAIVPEPTTWALMGLGALALFFRRRK
jgi:hypothetical protein